MTLLEKLLDLGATGYTNEEIETLGATIGSQFDDALRDIEHGDTAIIVRLIVSLLERRPDGDGAKADAIRVSLASDLLKDAQLADHAEAAANLLTKYEWDRVVEIGRRRREDETRFRVKKEES